MNDLEFSKYRFGPMLIIAAAGLKAAGELQEGEAAIMSIGAII